MVSFMLASSSMSSSGLRRRIGVLVVLALASANAAIALVACSSDSPSVDDASEGGAGDGNASSSSSGGDAKADTSSPRPDGGVKEGGNCTPVKGDCDIVLQDCPDDSKGKKQECVVTQGQGGGALKTSCVPVQPSQQLPMGHSCCPNGGDNPCLPGLTCVGDDCVDGGPVLARCSPACCEGDNAACGKSDPEGIGGQCDLTLFSNNTEVHRVCSYRERCKPYGVEPCKAGQICIVEDKVGTAGCINSNGIGNRKPCLFANDCADGFICAPSAQNDAGGECRMYCLTPNSNPPFDASAADGAPGRGGCPTGEQCKGPHFTDLPDWLQLCVYPDGG